MIISEKCNCCIHESICSFKEEYLAACAAIKDASYSKTVGTTVGYMRIKDSAINVSIRCPHIIPQSSLKTIERSDISA